jgi:fatty acid desaturase
VISGVTAVSGAVTKKKGLWRDPEGVLPNSIAFIYAVPGHIAGLWLLVQPSFLLVVLGVLLTAHSMVVGAYLVHECGHMTLFRSKSVNARVAEMLLWLLGAAYASFERIQHMHVRHHRDRADVSCFDYQAFLEKGPAWLKRVVIALEWAYIPAVELIMHAQVMIRPFTDEQYHGERGRMTLVLFTRLALFYAMFQLSPWSLLAYAIAYVLFLQALFLADAFAHTYEAYFVTDPREPVPGEGRDKAYDVDHTYSNLISTRWPVLNLINLNFGYHTAHHERSGVPWYRLPALHNELFGAQHPQILPYRELLKTIHVNRTRRIFVHDYGDVGTGPGRADGFVGAHGVSFLSIV